MHHLVISYIRLEKNLRQDDTSHALEVFEYLRAAFDEQRAGMVRSDSIIFTAELESLDTLLKMRS